MQVTRAAVSLWAQCPCHVRRQHFTTTLPSFLPSLSWCSLSLGLGWALNTYFNKLWVSAVLPTIERLLWPRLRRTPSKMRSQPWREVHKPIQKTVRRTPTKPCSPFLWPLAQYADRWLADRVVCQGSKHSLWVWVGQGDGCLRRLKLAVFII